MSLLVGVEVLLELEPLATVIVLAYPWLLIGVQQLVAVERALLHELLVTYGTLELLCSYGMLPLVLAEGPAVLELFQTSRITTRQSYRRYIRRSLLFINALIAVIIHSCRLCASESLNEHLLERAATVVPTVHVRRGQLPLIQHLNQ